MNRKNKLSQILSGIWISSLLLLMAAGCSDEYEYVIDAEPDEKTATVTVSLQVPGAFAGMRARSMETGQEKTIDHLQVLIFEETASEVEVYRSIGEVTKNSDTQVTLTLPVSDAKYRFVVLANAGTQTIPDGTSKQEALNRFAFDCAGQWPTGGDQSYIPMWGEFERTIGVAGDNSIVIGLHRALARVDVGLLFKPQTQDNQTEEVEGLENFKITSVRVYRTVNKAYVASSADRMNADKSEVIIPNIHPEAKYNSNDGSREYETMAEADKDPLLYRVTPASDSYIREIYIPESAFYDKDPNNTSMDDVPCLVIGGYYGKDNSSEETFYRIDFANYKTKWGVSTVAEYKRVLRNHRYVFNIMSVSSSGFKEPDQALHSVNADLKLSVVEWNEVSLNYHITGNYFFQIEKRAVELDAVYPVDGAGNPQRIEEPVFYRTNIPFIENPAYAGEAGVKGFVNVTWEWESTGTEIADYFTAYITPDENKIVFAAKSDNVGNGAQPRSDKLTLTIENMDKITIDVRQKVVTVDYNLLCGSTTVHGKYREGVPLNYTNYLEVTIRPILAGATLSEFEREYIEIASETRKGIYFAYKGTLQEGVANGDVTKNANDTYAVKLRGNGTPVKALNDRINQDTEEGILTRIDELRINTNAKNGAFCEDTSIIFGYQSKKILAIGANAIYRYGYMLEPNTGSRAFVDASINFGVDPNSTVTMEQFGNDYTHPGSYSNKSDATARGNAFHIEYMTAGRGMTGESINVNYLSTMLSEFKPDIILTGQAINFSDGAINLIADFVNRGGVMLMFNEYYPSVASINKMAGAVLGANLSGGNESLSGSEFFFKLPTEAGFANDPILNGSFGDLRGLQWGADGYFLHGFSGLPTNDIVIYNRRPGDSNPCFFRYTKKPFVFIGDGGFLSNAKRYIGPSYQGMRDYCPFAINSAYQPIARTNLLGGGYGEVDNSKIFGNILAWAVNYAEFNGINTK